MPNEILVILLGSLLILGASIVTRYLLLWRSSLSSVTRVAAVAVIAGFVMSLLLLLTAGAEIGTALFFSGSLAFVISAYLFLRNRLSR